MKINHSKEKLIMPGSISVRRATSSFTFVADLGRLSDLCASFILVVMTSLTDEQSLVVHDSNSGQQNLD